MSNMKIRYSIPARILELLYTDDAFFNEVLKLKKFSGNKFPKTDEWRDEHGFNLSFALAGYSPKDVGITVEGNVLIVSGNGIDSINPMPIDPHSSEDVFQEYSKESRPRIHIGSISRGIARRSFFVKHLISEEFEPGNAVATMEHGLLHVFIPLKDGVIYKEIKINEIKGEK